uniref:protein-synthesizing GTPase n=1 Tax=Marseillevirus LCMAC201 TaxID=2506605 RepID=A0A481YXB1_9VIRU|nr:MAG: translation initiation factor 2, beta subunit [Marseillevirus LCMAC201]
MDTEITQPIINIGLLGHVANGKSSLVRCVTGEKTARNDSRCMQKGESREMTIQIGYSNAKIYQCNHCPKPDCYTSTEGSKKQIPSCGCCGSKDQMKLVQFVSFVDCYHPETEVIMSDSICRPIKNIKAGDKVMGDDGTSRNVLHTQRGQKELYRIQYDNTEFTCTSGHLLVLRIDKPVYAPTCRDGGYTVEYYYSIKNGGIMYRSQRFNTKVEAETFYDTLEQSPIVYNITVNAYTKLSKRLKENSYLFRAEALDFSSTLDLSIKNASSVEIAWLIGIWLASGGSGLYIGDDGLCPTHLDKMYCIARKVELYTYTTTSKVYMDITTLQSCGLSTKRIPVKLKLAPLDIRYALLSGLINSNNNCYRKGQFEIVLKDPLLANDVLWLCRSLGYSSRIIHNRVQFNGGNTSQPFSVEKIGIGGYVGIETDGNSRFLLSDFTVGHNCPGHRMLMRNMISGSAVMDGAILVVDANTDVPQVQTLEHLTAAEIVGIDHYVAIAQNKIDLLLSDKTCEERLVKNHRQIQEFVRDTGADLSRTPVIPTCFSPTRQINLPILLQYLVERAKPNPHPAYKKYPMFIYCVRSFDVNKPCPAVNLKGGVIGGTIMNGVLHIGDTLEIRPGYKDDNGEFHPLYTKVTSLYTGQIQLQEARSGGLIGIGTTLDPALTRADSMVGTCAGFPGKLPDTTRTLDLKVYLLAQGIGHDQEIKSKISNEPSALFAKRTKLRVGDVLQLAVGAAIVSAKIIKRIKRLWRFETEVPICPVPGQSIPISKVIDNAWTIIGKGLLGGTEILPIKPNQDDFDPYNIILTQTLQETAPLPDLGGKLTIPSPQLTKDGTVRLIWINFSEICQLLNREETHLQTFFHDELSTRTSINADRQLIIHGRNRYQTSQIQSILIKYITTYVNCPSCRSVYTKLHRQKNSKYTQLLCQKCGAEYLR